MSFGVQRSPLGAYYRSTLGVRGTGEAPVPPVPPLPPHPSTNLVWQCVGSDGGSKNVILNSSYYLSSYPLAYSENATDWGYYDSVNAQGYGSCNVDYGSSLFVAPRPGYIATSTDGKTWAALSKSGFWQKVAYGDSLFVVTRGFFTGYGAEIITSPDGVTWTTRKSGEKKWEVLTYGGGKFVAAGQYSVSWWYSATSTDGITWTESSPLTGSGVWKDIAYGNSLFVAVKYNLMGYSSDGLTWSYSVDPDTLGWWRGVAFGNGLFVAVGLSSTGTASTKAITSTDGQTWTAVTVPSGVYNDIAYNGSYFIACGNENYGAGIITSPDGTTWTEQT